MQRGKGWRTVDGPLSAHAPLAPSPSLSLFSVRRGGPRSNAPVFFGEKHETKRNGRDLRCSTPYYFPILCGSCWHHDQDPHGLSPSPPFFSCLLGFSKISTEIGRGEIKSKRKNAQERKENKGQKTDERKTRTPCDVVMSPVPCMRLLLFSRILSCTRSSSSSTRGPCFHGLPTDRTTTQPPGFLPRLRLILRSPQPHSAVINHFRWPPTVCQSSPTAFPLSAIGPLHVSVPFPVTPGPPRQTRVCSAAVGMDRPRYLHRGSSPDTALLKLHPLSNTSTLLG